MDEVAKGKQGGEDPSAPKTTRPAAESRRDPGQATPQREKAGRKLDAMPDRIDIRDWFYQPGLAPLPRRVVNCDLIPEDLILDQGREGACTGFALAAVVNYHLHQRTDNDPKKPTYPVSPYMLYELARRYDEWPGEAYEGSSARGAMKAWVRHGVVHRDAWTRNKVEETTLPPLIAEAARRAPGGAFYRVMHRQIRDMHAALAENGILYATLMVHDGWGKPSRPPREIEYERNGQRMTISLPVITRDGPANAGHAIAIVGYTEDGFIIQNSWGPKWGAGGFALLPYGDYALHATDVWVAQLGVPVNEDIWAGTQTGATTGAARASEVIPLDAIRPFVVDVGNNGRLSDSGDYWTTEKDVETLFNDTIPQRVKDWPKRRVLLYLHGGLNSERDTAKRVLAMRDVLLENEIYPLHIMWESGAVETIRDIVEDIVKPDDRAGGVAEWLRKTRDGLIEAKDWTFELTASRPGHALWDEMKENARLSSERPQGDGAVQVMAKHLAAALAATARKEAARWELHVVAHSAGSIYGTYAMKHLLKSGIPLRSLHLLAPAMTVELFEDELLPLIEDGTCPRPDTYVLSDVGERDDDVGIYGKSLLYLVSNAFERERGTPLLGMERFIRVLKDKDAAKDQVPKPDARIMDALAPGLVVAGERGRNGLGPSRSDSHGGFDNDPDTLNSVLRRILGAKPRREFVPRDLQF